MGDARKVIGEWTYEPQVSEALDALDKEGFHGNNVTDERYSLFTQPEIKGRRVGFYATVHKPKDGEAPVTTITACLDTDPTEGDKEYERIAKELAEWKKTKQGELEAELQQAAGMAAEVMLPQAIETPMLPSFKLKGTDAGNVARRAKKLVERLMEAGYGLAPKYFRH